MLASLCPVTFIVKMLSLQIYGFLPESFGKAALAVSLPAPTCALQASISPGSPGHETEVVKTQLRQTEQQRQGNQHGWLNTDDTQASQMPALP